MELIDRAQLVVQDRVEKMIAEGTAEQLALTFTERGILAICGKPELCAIAVYLMGELAGELGEEASNIHVNVPGGKGMNRIDLFAFAANHDPHHRRVHFSSSSPLGEFAYRFDQEEFPALIEPDSLEGSGRY